MSHNLGAHDDASSSSGEEDVNIANGSNKRRSTTSLNSTRRKRNRKGPSDAIVDAMLEIAAASKLRANAMMRDELSEMNESDLELDEMELVAAATGYYYYSQIFLRQIYSDVSPELDSIMLSHLSS
ncbi:hypothetical protein IFM89_009893 [Coptis chinensis]|uniref:Uncharacterized protein n=1 Tax=Coptis chinensis TaxID=261450 RepID=A0A835LXD7_9MAGN|nr:hypothetical protein IFM89_009893 [Coptis chinensis]